MNIEQQLREHQSIANKQVHELSVAEFEFCVCVAKGGKNCNIEKPNDLSSEDDSEFIVIEKKTGHPFYSDIKHFDLMHITARNKKHREFLIKKYETQYWHCLVKADYCRDKKGNRILCDIHAIMYKPSGGIKNEWNDMKKWGIHSILDSIPEQNKKTISFKDVWALIKV